MAAHNSLCTGHILQHGSEAQKAKYLPKLATGEWIGAWGLTEPNTGSDAGNMKTVAVKEGGVPPKRKRGRKKCGAPPKQELGSKKVGALPQRKTGH